MENDRIGELRRAGFVERAGAFSVDLLLIVWTYTIVLRLIVAQPLKGGVLSFLVAYVILLATLGMLSLSYFSILNSGGRQTLGKRIFGLVTVRSDGGPLSWRRGLFRSYAYAISEFALYLGFLWVIWDKRRQGWHDRLARTAVLSLRPQTDRSRALAVFCFACLVASALCPSSAVKERFRAFTTPTASMVETLLPGDYFIADLGFLRFHDVARGNVIVFDPPEGNGDQAYIKRCVALEGENVEIKQNHLYIDGACVPEPYVHLEGFPSPFADYGPVRVPQERVFVLGDNRDNSLDSRYFGPLERDRIVGRANLIYWSMDPEGGRWRIGRIGRRIE